MLRILFTFQKYPPTTALTHSSSHSCPPLTHPFSLPSRSPLSSASPRRRHRPLLDSLSLHHHAPRTVGQKLDFLGAGDELLAGGGAGSACFDAGDEATWIRAGCCWRTSGCGWTWCGASARCWPTTRRAPPRCGTPGAHPERRRCRGLVRPPLPRPPRPWVPLAARPRACTVYASNDAAFTDEEFASIPRIGGRKKSSQAWKTGSKMGASYTLYRCRALLRAAALSI